MAASRVGSVQQMKDTDAALAAAAKAITVARKALTAAINQMQTQGLGDAPLGTGPLGD